MAKSIKTLLEGELEKAQLALAARDLVDQLLTMVQDLTKLKVEDLPALKESIRGAMDNETADHFVSTVDPALDAAIQAVNQAQTQVDQAALAIAGDAAMPMSTPDNMGVPVGDNIPDLGDEEAPAADTAAGGDEPLGRGKRESRINRMKAMMESLERKIAATKKANRVTEAKKSSKKKVKEETDSEKLSRKADRNCEKHGKWNLIKDGHACPKCVIARKKEKLAKSKK